MPESSTLIGFSVAALVLFVVPGPAVLYIVTRSVAQGRRAGLVSVGGIHVGSLVHIAAAVAGLSTLLATSATAFRVVKWAGAAYLVYLGIRSFTEREEPAGPGRTPSAPLGRVFRQGVVVNLLNPKTAVFFLAFVPQFVDTSRPATSQVLVLGGLFVLLGVLSDGMYALVTGSLAERLQRRSWWSSGKRAVSGSVYVTLGVLAALGTADPDPV